MRRFGVRERAKVGRVLRTGETMLGVKLGWLSQCNCGFWTGSKWVRSQWRARKSLSAARTMAWSISASQPSRTGFKLAAELGIAQHLAAERAGGAADVLSGDVELAAE